MKSVIRNRTGICMVALSLLGLAFTVGATTRTVGLGGASPNYTTISNALAAASDGDVIQIVTNVQTECGITVAKSVTIQGYGPGVTVVQGAASRSNAASNRIFALNSAKTLLLQNMTIQYGFISNNIHYAQGGAALLSSAGTAIVQNCMVVMNDCYITNAGFGGGGIYVSSVGTLAISNSVVSSNTVTAVGASGGGVNFTGNSFVSDASTFVANSAPKYGGAIYFSVVNNAATIRNSTLIFNQAGSGGGALYNLAALSMYNCTVYSNVANYGGSVNAAQNLNICNCILAGGLAANGAPSEYYGGASITISNSLIQGTTGNNGTFKADVNNIKGVDPKLLPLANNGGPTPTCALLQGSPCIGAANPATELPYDQRGYARITPDIGAYAYGGHAPYPPGTTIYFR